MTIALVDEVIERGKAFADAGASGFFVPRLADPRQIERIVREVPLPLNVIAFPGAPTKAEWAECRRRADQPRALPAPGADGEARGDGAGSDRLGALAGRAATSGAAWADLQDAAAEQLAPRRRITATQSACQAKRQQVRPERGMFGRAREHREGRGEREDRGGDGAGDFGHADARRRNRTGGPAPW